MNEPKPIRRVSAKKYRGLGDVVEALAAPVAKAIDRLAGTDLKHCKGCGKRREEWNTRFPL